MSRPYQHRTDSGEAPRSSSVLSPTLRNRVDRLLGRSTPRSSSSVNSPFQSFQQDNRERNPNDGLSPRVSPSEKRRNSDQFSRQSNLYSFAESQRASQLTDQNVGSGSAYFTSPQRKSYHLSTSNRNAMSQTSASYGIVDTTMYTEDMYSSNQSPTTNKEATQLDNWENLLVNRLEAQVPRPAVSPSSSSWNDQQQESQTSLPDSVSAIHSSKKPPVRPLKGKHTTSKSALQKSRGNTPARSLRGSQNHDSIPINRTTPEVRSLGNDSKTHSKASEVASVAMGEPPKTQSSQNVKSMPATTTTTTPSMQYSATRQVHRFSMDSPSSDSSYFSNRFSTIKNNSLRYSMDVGKLRRRSIQTDHNVTGSDRKWVDNEASVSSFRPLLGTRANQTTDAVCVSDKLDGIRNKEGTRSRSVSPRRDSDKSRATQTRTFDGSTGSNRDITKDQHSTEKQRVLDRVGFRSSGNTPSTHGKSLSLSSPPTDRADRPPDTRTNPKATRTDTHEANIEPSERAHTFSPSTRFSFGYVTQSPSVLSSAHTPRSRETNMSPERYLQTKPLVTSTFAQESISIKENSEGATEGVTESINSVRTQISPWATAAPVASLSAFQESESVDHGETRQERTESAQSPAFTVHKQMQSNMRFSKSNRNGRFRTLLQTKSLVQTFRNLVFNVRQVVKAETNWISDGFSLLGQQFTKFIGTQGTHKLRFDSQVERSEFSPPLRSFVRPISNVGLVCQMSVSPKRINDNGQQTSPVMDDKSSHFNATSIQSSIEGAQQELSGLREENDERKNQMEQLRTEIEAIREVLKLSQSQQRGSPESFDSHNIIVALTSQMEALEKQLRQTQTEYETIEQRQTSVGETLHELEDNASSNMDQESRNFFPDITHQMARMSRTTSSLVHIPVEYEPFGRRYTEADEMKQLQQQVASLRQAAESAQSDYNRILWTQKEAEAKVKYLEDRLAAGTGSFKDPNVTRTSGSSIRISPGRERYQDSAEVAELQREVADLRRVIQDSQTALDEHQLTSDTARKHSTPTSTTYSESLQRNSDGTTSQHLEDPLSARQRGIDQYLRKVSSSNHHSPMNASGPIHDRKEFPPPIVTNFSTQNTEALQSHAVTPSSVGSNAAHSNHVRDTQRSTPVSRKSVDDEKIDSRTYNRPRRSLSSPQKNSPRISVSSPSSMPHSERQQKIAEIFARAASVRKEAGRNSERATVLLETYAQRMRNMKGKEYQRLENEQNEQSGDSLGEALDYRPSSSHSQQSVRSSEMTQKHVAEQSRSNSASEGMFTHKRREWRTALLSPSSETSAH